MLDPPIMDSGSHNLENSLNSVEHRNGARRLERGGGEEALNTSIVTSLKIKLYNMPHHKEMHAMEWNCDGRYEKIAYITQLYFRYGVPNITSVSKRKLVCVAVRHAGATLGSSCPTVRKTLSRSLSFLSNYSDKQPFHMILRHVKRCLFCCCYWKHEHMSDMK
ncbi:hypothetical protein ACJX0J_027753 [Zea mays]